MLDNKINKLIEMCTDELEKTELKTLYAAAVKKMAEYNSERTAAVLRDWTAAKEALDVLVARIEGRAAAGRLANRLEVLGWLKKQGYKVGKSKVYADAAAGLLKLAADGSCSEDGALRYAKKTGLKQYAEVATADLDRMNKERAEQEIRLLTKKTEKLEFEIARSKGEYLPRADFEQELAARAAALKAGLSHLAMSRAVEWGAAWSGGGAQALSDLAAEDFDGLLHDFATMESFQVIVVDGGMEKEDQ